MSEAGWVPNETVEPAIDELKAQVQKIYNAGYAAGRVAGLKAVRRKITDLMDRAFTDYEEDMDDLTEWLDFQIEQQAQGDSVRCQRCGGSGYTQSDDPARPLSRCGMCQGDGRHQPSQAQGGMR